MMARVKFKGLPELNRKLKLLQSRFKKEIASAMEIGAQEIVTMAKSLAPLGEATGVNSSNNPGALKDSINWTWGKAPPGTIVLGNIKNRKPDANDMIITIYAGNDEAFYARWVEFGTRPHIIRVKKARFMTRGGVNFGTKVNHPGATQKAFFYPSYRALRTRTKRRISRAVNKAARSVAQL